MCAPPRRALIETRVQAEQALKRVAERNEQSDAEMRGGEAISRSHPHRSHPRTADAKMRRLTSELTHQPNTMPKEAPNGRR